MRVEFWGVRGKVVMTEKIFLRYGGNTPCVCVESDGHRILLDAGMGLVRYGRAMANLKQDISVYITHYHWDHIQGFPFTPLIHTKGNTVRFYAPAFGEKSAQEQLEYILSSPYSPLGTAKTCAADVSFYDVEPSSFINDGPFSIIPVEVPHGNSKCLAYVISDGKKQIVYAPDFDVDHEHIPTHIDSAFTGTDAMIIDCTHFEAMLAEAKPDGHSSYERSMALCASVGCPVMIPFHYYEMEDDKIDLIIKNIQRPSRLTITPAQEGASIEV